jgi:hypothetical protein
VSRAMRPPRAKARGAACPACPMASPSTEKMPPPTMAPTPMATTSLNPSLPLASLFTGFTGFVSSSAGRITGKPGPDLIWLNSRLAFFSTAAI